MEVNLDQENKNVEIWLTHSESQDEELRQILKPQIAEYHQKKFLVVVYESGKADLFETTRDLLQHNLHLSASKAAKEGIIA